MSYSNGYTNGSYRTNRYEDPQDDSDSVGGSRPRRAGGYGGLHNGAPSEPEPQPPRPSFRWQGADSSDGTSGTSVSRTRDTDGHDTHKSRDRGARGQNGARQYGSGPGGRQIEG